MLVLLQAGLPAHAEGTADKADAFTDALIPLVVLDSEKSPAAVKVDDRGFTWNGVALASQPARPLDAIMIDVTLTKANVKRALLLTYLGKLELDAQGRPAAGGPGTQQAWCKDSVNLNASIDCFRDSDGDGKLDQHARGYLPRLEALSLNRIGAFETIDPIPYRKAEPAELPVFNIDYLVCGTGPEIKFARRIKKVGLLAGSVSGQCDNVAIPVPNQTEGDSVVLLDQARIRIRILDGARTSQMTEGMPAGLLIGNLRTDRPIADLAHAKRFSEEHDETLGELPDIYISTPPTIAADPVKPGQTFFSAEIKHGITGTLRAAAIQLKIFKGKPVELIPAGARMFGVQMRSDRENRNLDANIVWCYPGPLNGADARAKCIARDAMSITHVLDAWERFTVSSLGIGSIEPAIEDPVIDRDDLDFGEPIVLEIAVEKIAKKRITVRTSMDRLSERNKSSRHRELLRSNNGNAYLLIGHGILMLEPVDADTVRVSERVPVMVGSDADIDDAVALQRSFR
jgi:hypothetical protein